MGFNVHNPVQAKRSSGGMSHTLHDPGGVEPIILCTTPPGLIVCGDRLPRTALRLYGVTHILPHSGQIISLIIVCINYFSYTPFSNLFISRSTSREFYNQKEQASYQVPSATVSFPTFQALIAYLPKYFFVPEDPFLHCTSRRYHTTYTHDS